jgi:hypothetical protein
MKKLTIALVSTAALAAPSAPAALADSGVSSGGACVSNAGPSVTIGAWGVSGTPAQFQSMTFTTGPISQCTGPQGAGA